MKNGKLYLLLTVLMVSAFTSVPLASASADDGVLNYGVGSLLVDLDPQQAWDSASLDVIDQVCEPLLGYDLSTPDLEIIPILAANLGTWNEDATNYTISLRQNVTFHDGNEFDAYDVNWTFSRLNHLIETNKSQIAELYEPLNGELVINHIEIVDQYTVCFVLNYPYVPFESLLCFSGSYILSEESTPYDELLNTATDTLVGTGPYRYIIQTSVITDLLAYDDWWGERPEQYIEEILFILYSDNTAKDQAFLAGQLDWVDGSQPEFLGQFMASADHYVGEQRQGTGINYLGMNNKLIDKTMRQAISFAIDYEYIIEEIMQGNAARMTSPIPAGIMYHSPDLDVPYLNVTHARQILIDAERAPADAADHLNDDTWWTTLTANDPIGTYNYTWNTGNAVREDLGVLIKSNLEKIGVAVDLTGMVFADFLTRLLGEFDKLALYMVGWGADYNDPSNFINPLFSNTSASNGAQVNDPQLQVWMMEALTEVNSSSRRDMYYEIQEYVVEDLMPWAFLFVTLNRGIWSMELSGIYRNPMQKIHFASMNWQGMTTTGASDDSIDTDDTNGTGGIPGYSFVALVGAAAVGLTVFMVKKRR